MKTRSTPRLPSMWVSRWNSEKRRGPFLPFVAFSARSFVVCCIFCTVLSLPFVAFSVLSCPCHLLRFLYCLVPAICCVFCSLVPAICCIFCTVLSLPHVAFFCTVLCHWLHFLLGPLSFVAFSARSFAICCIFCLVPCYSLHLLLSLSRSLHFLLGPLPFSARSFAIC